MENNERILEEYGKQIASYPKLTNKEARDLYAKYSATDDKKKKKKYMDELILGTLYVVYNYIKDKNILMFCTKSYDANDIISAFNEAWIRELYNNSLETSKNFSAILYGKTYISNVYKCLGIGKNNLLNNYNFDSDKFISLLLKYIKAKYYNEDFSYYHEIDTSLEKPLNENYYNGLYYYHQGKKYFDKDVRKEYLISHLLANIYKNLKLKDDINWQELTVKLKRYLNLVINLGMEVPLNNNWLTEDHAETALQKRVISNAFKELFDEIEIVGGERSHNGRRGKLVKEIMLLRYGFVDNDVKTFAEIGKILNISEQRAQQLSAYSLHLVYDHRVLRKLNQCIFYVKER